MLTPVAAPAVGIPAANAADEEKAEPALAPAAGAISVEVGPTEEEIAAAEAAEREAAEQEAAEQAAQQEAEQEQTQDDSSGQDETREDDSASRSGERSERSEDSDSSQQDSSESSSDESQQESSPAPSSAAKGSSVLATARSGIGTPYVFGGTSPSGWDCSGFVQWVYAQHGVSLPRGADAQAASGTVISRSEARPGDLVWKPGHIGIYAGGNKFVDAGNSRVDTTERNIYSGNWTFVRVG
jgi:cell wall-associated NlpC family hydrolase